VVTDDSELPTAEQLRAHLRCLVDAQIQVEKPTRELAHSQINRWSDAEVFDQWFLNFPEEIIHHLLNQDLGALDEPV
jgi:hypothetical protein